MFTELLTVEKAAQVIAVSPSYLYKLVRLKQLPAVKIGTSVRIRPDDLETFIHSKLTMMYREEVPVHVWESPAKRPSKAGGKKKTLE